MTQIATRKLAEKPAATTAKGDPKARRTTVAVRKVEVANTAKFKRIVRGFLLMRKVLDTPSRADITTAAAPP